MEAATSPRPDNEGVNKGDTQKRKARPPCYGKDPHVTTRMPAEMIVEVDAWAASNEIGRSEAIRRLVELGLKAKK